MEDIWGYTPDEIRPFPALSYQIAAVFGAASPTAESRRQHRCSTPATRCSSSPSRRRAAGLARRRRPRSPALRVRAAADADRVGGLDHRTRRLDAGVLLPGVVPALRPLARRRPAPRLRLVGGVVRGGAALEAEHRDRSARAWWPTTCSCAAQPAATDVGVAAALPAVRRADRRLPGAALRAVRRGRPREHAQRPAAARVRDGRRPCT